MYGYTFVNIATVFLYDKLLHVNFLHTECGHI